MLAEAGFARRRRLRTRTPLLTRVLVADACIIRDSVSLA